MNEKYWFGLVGPFEDNYTNLDICENKIRRYIDKTIKHHLNNKRNSTAKITGFYVTEEQIKKIIEILNFG